MKDIVKRLEEYRLKNRIPQVELAKKLKVPFATINRCLMVRMRLIRFKVIISKN